MFINLDVESNKGSVQITANLDNNYRSTSMGIIRYSINYGYTLYNDEYSFEVDENSTFKLKQLQNHR
ncbi:hypothetical protein [Allomuricauda sp. F6463D]|uniref:hypothetical protein n=1 Tax=Allomuricauda sp. F6463D TaxID=2926409 RepID=UPI001FF0FA77|nr:hypothetical protein [Muricauda sp. F6463D]MCK0159581.1 hypothetical protein [Muricauda sp. F6463D]